VYEPTLTDFSGGIAISFQEPRERIVIRVHGVEAPRNFLDFDFGEIAQAIAAQQNFKAFVGTLPPQPILVVKSFMRVELSGVMFNFRLA
jgi:hypothetical protein